MQKLFRSLFAIGVLGALAACGDDVSVQPPPDPDVVISGAPSTAIRVGQTVQLSANQTVTWATSAQSVATVSTSGLVTAVNPGSVSITATSAADATKQASVTITVSSGVQSVEVVPTVMNLTVGQTQPASATVTRDAGVAGTVTWTSNNVNVASVNGTTGVVTAVAIGSAQITATSTVDATKSASLQVNVGASANALTSLTVTPTQVNLGPGGTQAVVTNTTTATPAAGTVNVTYANSSNSTACTVTAAGANPTITAVANGTCVITITATGTPSAAGSGLQANSLSATVNVNVEAAAASLAGLQQNNAPVNLAGVAGQIEAIINITSGNQQIGAVAAFFGLPIGGSCENANIVWVEAARQTFGVNGAPNAPVSLSIPTASFNATTFVPLYLNGEQCIRAQVEPVNGSAPTATNTIKFTLTNQDVVYFDATVDDGGAGLNHTGNSATRTSAPFNTWWKGGFTYQAHPVLYSGVANVVSITYNSTDCGAVAAAPPNFVATFTCSGVEDAQNITQAITITYVAGYTLTTSPTLMMTAASAGFVPGSPVFSVVSTNEDNVGPTTAIVGVVAFNDLFDQMWVNSQYAFLSDFSFVDPGVGVDLATRTVRLWTGTCAGTVIITGADLAETVASDGSPDGYRNCANANDALGNVGGSTGATNFYGVDKGAPTVRLAGSTAATPSIAPATVASASATPNTSIYSIASPFVASDVWGVEGQDTRSGFNQNAVAGFPAVQSMVNHVPAAYACGFTNPLSVALSDNWVRVAVLVPFDCGTGAPGYFWYTGHVVDRAGNQSSQITRNFAIDQYAVPVVSAILPAATFMTVGQPATFNVYGTDDLEVIEADLILEYPGAAPITGIAYPQSTSGVRWDQGAGALNTPVQGQPLSVAVMLGRIDQTCSGAAAPYAGCAIADGKTAVAAEYNNVGGGTDAEKRVTGATATLYDVASQPSAAFPSQPINALQLSGTVAQQWASADIVRWRLTSTAGATITAEHMASTSITAPYFDQVLLARAYGTTLVLCGSQFAVGQMTDNGINRFFPYSVTKPTSGPCALAGGGLWYAVSLKGGAALITQGL